MTTIIREGQYLYTDSRYGIYFGGYRTHEDGPCKISKSKDGSCVIGMAGTFEPTIPFDLLQELIDEAIIVLNENRLNKSLSIGKLREFYKQLAKDDEYHEYSILVCNPKGTYMIKTGKSNDPFEMYYNPNQNIAAGSGALIYTPFRNAAISIEEKFKIIYQADEHSGGNVHRFDINSLAGAK